jgi:ABC-type glycerol-3-phosphate transport system substrate-binding protein
MSIEDLTLWIHDRELSRALIEFPAGTIRVFDWNWKEFHTALLKSLNEGSAPDLIEIGNTWTGRLVQEGVLLKITQFATEFLSAASTFFPFTLHSCRGPFQIDQYYALPLFIDMRILFYNQDYLGSYLADHPQAFTSWSAFEEMCQALKAQLPHRVIAWSLDSNAFHDVLPWVWSAGGDFIPSPEQVLIDSERTREAIYRLTRLILTGCAPLPPDPSFNGLDRLWAEFATGNIGMMTGALWMTRAPGWQKRFKATLHPPDPFLAPFIGGSNLAIVRKHGKSENAEAYQPAKAFLASMVSSDNQPKYAEAVGKLPSNISAWRQMRKQAADETFKELLDVFNEGLRFTDRSLPNLPNFVQIEEELKICMPTIWEKVGEIIRDNSKASLDQLEKACKLVIDKELDKTKQKLTGFLTNVVKYSKKEVQELGITPPGQFDLWLQVTSLGPKVKGTVYSRDRKGKIQVWSSSISFQILQELVEAPQRRLSQEELLSLVWPEDHSISDRERMENLISWGNELALLVKLFEISLEGTPKHLFDELKKHQESSIYAEFADRLSGRYQWGTDFSRIQFQRSLCKSMDNRYEAIKHDADRLNLTRAKDRLRKARGAIEDELGQIIEIKGDLYQLDNSLAICLVAP